MDCGLDTVWTIEEKKRQNLSHNEIRNDGCFFFSLGANLSFLGVTFFARSF